MSLNMAKLQRWLVSSWWYKKFTEKSCLGFGLSLLVMLVWIYLYKECFLFFLSLQPYLCAPEGLSQHWWLQSHLLKWKTQNNALNFLCSWGIKRNLCRNSCSGICSECFPVSVSSTLVKKQTTKTRKPTPWLISQRAHQEFESRAGGREESFGIIYVLKCSPHSTKHWIFKPCC